MKNFHNLLFPMILLLVMQNVTAQEIPYVLEQNTVKFIPSSGGHPVEMSFLGRIHERDAGLMINGDARDHVARFIWQVVSANKTDDKEKILENWLPNERSDVAAMMDNKNAFERNRSLFSNINDSRLIGVVRYGDFLLAYVKHDLTGVGDYIKIYPVTYRDNNYYLSNSLSGDFFYSRISDAIAEYIWPD